MTARVMPKMTCDCSFPYGVEAVFRQGAAVDSGLRASSKDHEGSGKDDVPEFLKNPHPSLEKILSFLHYGKFTTPKG